MKDLDYITPSRVRYLSKALESNAVDSSIYVQLGVLPSHQVPTLQHFIDDALPDHRLAALFPFLQTFARSLEPVIAFVWSFLQPAFLWLC